MNLTQDWKKQAKTKVAAATQNDRAAIAEAFAQQAYTAIGNRCRLIMKDPYLLGFEVVETNEQNNRLVGVFAFRVSGEILLAPVFYLNGQVKGQIMMYRKGVNRICPNNEKWISYLIARGEDSLGRGIEPRNGQDATMDLNMYQLAGPPKMASAGSVPTNNGWDIQKMWKEAKDAWTIIPPEHLFADVITHAPHLKKAAEQFAARFHPFAEMLVLGKCLEQPVTMKKAAAPPRGEVKVHFAPIAGSTEQQVEEFYKRGFALEDTRGKDMKVDTVWTDEVFATMHTANRAGVQTVLTEDDKRVKVLFAPKGGSGICNSVGGERSGYSYNSYVLLFLEGKDKGKAIEYRERDPGKLPVFSEDRQIESKGNKGMPSLDADDDIGDKVPSKGKAYIVWFPSKQKAMERTLYVRSVDKSGNVIRINMADGVDASNGERFILRTDLDETLDEDLSGYGENRIIAGDARFVEIDVQLEYAHGQPQTPQNVAYVREVPPSVAPLSMDRLQRGLLNNKKASITVKVVNGEFVIDAGKKSMSLFTPSATAMKLASLGIDGAESCEIVDRAGAGETIRLDLLGVRGLEKAAGAFFDRDIDPNVDFEQQSYDPDLGIPVEYPDHMQQRTQARREQQVGPTPRYLDAHDPGQGRQGMDHIPDEMILQMTNPAQELAQLGQQMGMEQLIDHGAVASMAKIFDAKPYIIDYVGKMEGSIDYLGRTLFMLYWKPNDFAEMFGSDDLPHLENKLTGVFESYGDLVLELKQAVQEKPDY